MSLFKNQNPPLDSREELFGPYSTMASELQGQAQYEPGAAAPTITSAAPTNISATITTAPNNVRRYSRSTLTATERVEKRLLKSLTIEEVRVYPEKKSEERKQDIQQMERVVVMKMHRLNVQAKVAVQRMERYVVMKKHQLDEQTKAAVQQLERDVTMKKHQLNKQVNAAVEDIEKYKNKIKALKVGFKGDNTRSEMFCATEESNRALTRKRKLKRILEDDKDDKRTKRQR